MFICSYYTSTKSWRGYIFTSVCLCVCVCVSVCLCVRHFLWTKFQPNGCTDFDAVFAKWLLSTLARTQLKLLNWGKGQGHSHQKTQKYEKKIRQKFKYAYFWILFMPSDSLCYYRHFDAKYVYDYVVQKKQAQKSN